GEYHTPHGLANAIMLPHVLRFSAPAITDRLARLAVRAKVGKEGEPARALAEKFMDAVEQLNRDLDIPGHLEALREADIPALARAACSEAQGYPVPRYMTQKQCEDIIRKVLPPGTSKPAAKPAAKAPRKPKATAEAPAAPAPKKPRSRKQ
ncbi:MAG: iron-containing alcohol dehydrogenase, partial [Rhodocyclaceae bacterium]|nr:iron-containing alcohol dehydrogenase [Rhodocyclaceae bacterium]